MKRFLLRTTVATTAVLALAGCSSSSSDSAAGGSSEGGADAHGPITFAMGKNDTDKVTPIIEKWNEQHPDEKVTLKELAGEADAQRETLVQSLQAGSDDYDVMALDVVWTAEFAANQWLQPLNGDFETNTDESSTRCRKTPMVSCFSAIPSSRIRLPRSSQISNLHVRRWKTARTV